MKFKILIVVCICFLMGAVSYHDKVIRPQKALLRLSAQRLQQAESYLAHSQITTALDLLLQTKQDLDDSQTVFSPPSIRGVHQTLLLRHTQLATTLDARLSLIQATLAELADAVEHSAFSQAENRLHAKAEELPGNSVIINALSEYVHSLKFQDFDGARKCLATLTKYLPDTGDTARGIERLTRFLTAEQQTNRERQQHIALDVQAQIDWQAVHDAALFMPALQGRAMVWDFTKNDVDPAYELLPEKLRASKRDERITMFCIIRRERATDADNVLQEKTSIGVMYWPQKTTAGTAVVEGEVSEKSTLSEYDSPVRISNWIAALPRQEIVTLKTAFPKRTAPAADAPRAIPKATPAASLDQVSHERTLGIRSFPLYPLENSSYDYQQTIEQCVKTIARDKGFSLVDPNQPAPLELRIGYGFCQGSDENGVIAALFKDYCTSAGQLRTLLRKPTYSLNLHLYLWDVPHGRLLAFFRCGVLPESGNAADLRRVGPEAFLSRRIQEQVADWIGSLAVLKDANGTLSVDEDLYGAIQSSSPTSARRVYVDLHRDDALLYYWSDPDFEKTLYDNLAQAGWICAPTPEGADCILRITWKRRHRPGAYPYVLSAQFTVYPVIRGNPADAVFTQTVFVNSPAVNPGTPVREATIVRWRNQYQTLNFSTTLTEALDRASH